MKPNYLIKKKSNKIGYIYVKDDEPEFLQDAQVGSMVKIQKEGPPWIVVEHEVKGVTIARWPGRLWRAEVLDEAKNTGLREDANYTRANAVRILDELPIDILFGSCGRYILEIIESTRSIEIDIANTLSRVFPSEALELYSKGWNLFAGTYIDAPPFYGEHNFHTIAMPSVDGESPIHSGFAVIQLQIFNRANELTNGTAILKDEEGNVWLDSDWSKVAASYLCAAMAVAYQDEFTAHERKVLLHAWETVHGQLFTNPSNDG